MPIAAAVLCMYIYFRIGHVFWMTEAMLMDVAGTRKRGIVGPLLYYYSITLFCILISNDSDCSTIFIPKLYGAFLGSKIIKFKLRQCVESRVLYSRAWRGAGLAIGLYWAIGLLGHWTIWPLDHWAIGPLDHFHHWTISRMERRTTEYLESTRKKNTRAHVFAKQDLDIGAPVFPPCC